MGMPITVQDVEPYLQQLSGTEQELEATIPKLQGAQSQVSEAITTLQSAIDKTVEALRQMSSLDEQVMSALNMIQKNTSELEAHVRGHQSQLQMGRLEEWKNTTSNRQNEVTQIKTKTDQLMQQAQELRSSSGGFTGVSQALEELYSGLRNDNVTVGEGITAFRTGVGNIQAADAGH